MTYDAHGVHHEAVGFAGLEVEELEGALMAAFNRAEEVLRVVANAVGDSPTHQAGHNALNIMAGVKEHINETVGMCEQVKAELIRYANGF